ncbi:hypothetical protein C0992_002757, partial [Termitomyces sp. T32_za158]
EDHEKPINEDEVTDAHRKAYDEGNTSGLSANSLGSAAALQVSNPLCLRCVWTNNDWINTGSQAIYLWRQERRFSDRAYQYGDG